jgi:hypothetical protein
MKFLRHPRHQESGFILPATLIFGIMLLAFGVAMATTALSNYTMVRHEQRSESALEVAEAGVNYYLWHLAHNSSDFQDGTGAPATPPYGPYTHNFNDASGNLVGTYTLTITPPASGSTITTVQSVGKVPGLAVGRTILAQIGEPSFANYVLLTATEVWFGPSESASGPVQSNIGVHMDGTNNGPVTAASATYTPAAEYGGDGRVHNGVWGNGGPTSQWQYPVPSIDFSKVTANLSTLQTSAQSGGKYLAPSGKLGYYLHLRSDGKIDIYTVKAESQSTGLTTTLVTSGATAPANGILYAADNVWVDGTGFPGRLTIVAAVLPANASTYASITITNNLTYAAKDGSAAIGLIAQNNVRVANYAPSTIEVDGALLAQNGEVYVDSSAPVKTALTLFGAIASFSTWTWSWVNGSGTVVAGYQTDTNTFDTNLIYAPPPSYPTTGTFAILNWREKLYSP